MNISAICTKKVVVGDTLEDILETSLPPLKERDIVVITSKIVSICEGRVLPDDGIHTKKELAQKEAELYFRNDQTSRYEVTLTINHDVLIVNAGVDHSNGNGNFILWPKNPMNSAQHVWQQLKTKYTLRYLGVIISDSHLVPLRWGTQGFGLAWCGFDALNNYIGKPDIFGTPLQSTKLAILDGLAAAAVVVMGEGNEQTPIAVIRDIPSVSFQDRPPTKKEIADMKISLQDDMYAPLLTSIPWRHRD